MRKYGGALSTEVVIRLYEGRPPAPVTPDTLRDWVLEQVAANHFVVTSYSAVSNRDAFTGVLHQDAKVVLEQQTAKEDT